jgi:ABC-type transport system involved in cytochrome c biogenesis permease subunit
MYEILDIKYKTIYSPFRYVLSTMQVLFTENRTMTIVLWSVLALGAGFVALWVAARRARREEPPLPDDIELPATPLQRISRWGVGLSAVLAVAAAALLLWNGAEATFDSDSLRITFTLLLVGIVAVVGGVGIWLRAQVGRSDGLLDERDRAILGRAPAAQAMAMLVTLAVWTIGLAEHFHDAGAVPVFYLYLVFWSVVVVDLLGLPVGILMGYRRF